MGLVGFWGVYKKWILSWFLLGCFTWMQVLEYGCSWFWLMDVYQVCVLHKVRMPLRDVHMYPSILYCLTNDLRIMQKHYSKSPRQARPFQCNKNVGTTLIPTIRATPTPELAATPTLSNMGENLIN